MSLKSKLSSIWPSDSATRQFRRHLRRSAENGHDCEGLVLVEAFQPPSNVVALSLLVPQLHDGRARAVGYHQTVQGWPRRLLARIRYRASPISVIAAKRLLLISPGRPMRRRAAAAAEALLAHRLEASEFESIEIDGTLIGDLAYDLYLRRTDEPTIDVEDPRLKDALAECIAYVYFWSEYLSKGTVLAVCVSHCVYHHGIPNRMALQRGIPTFQVTAESLYRMTDEFPMAYTDQVLFPEQFRQLDVAYREQGVGVARERLSKRFSGEIGIDMVYSTVSAYSSAEEAEGRVLRPSEKIKVLVAAHDFFDSPHAYGMNLYPDFLIWMRHLGEISLQVDYDWYIKTHPDIQGSGSGVLADFVSQYPHFTILPAVTSHHAIIRDGIDVALTVFGTIGMEYPALGVPVVNASPHNPHAAYGFSLTPRSVGDYERILLELGDHLYTPATDQIHEYHFMRHIHQLQTWVFADYDHYLERIGGYRQSMTSRAYSIYLAEYSGERHAATDRAVRRFLASNDIRIGRQHFED